MPTLNNQQTFDPYMDVRSLCSSMLPISMHITCNMYTCQIDNMDALEAMQLNGNCL